MAAELFCGCHVVCIDAKPLFDRGPTPLVEGRVYVVVHMRETDGVVFVCVDGIGTVREGGWLARRFKPLDENRLSWARAIANGERVVEAA